MKEDLSTPEGWLRSLLVKNEHGVWFLKISENRYQLLEKWKWVYLEKVVPNPEVLKR